MLIGCASCYPEGYTVPCVGLRFPGVVCSERVRQPDAWSSCKVGCSLSAVSDRPVAVVLPEREAGQGEGRKVERLTRRTTLRPSPRPARLVLGRW